MGDRVTGASPGVERWGAYGLHLEPSGSARWLVPAPPDWRTVSLRSVDAGSAASGRPTSEEVSVTRRGSQVQIDAAGSWRLALDTDGRTATYHGITLGSPELVHPGLAATAAILSRAWGRAAFHAGGFVVDGRAWGVLGAREAGKTTLLAALAALGVGVVADDLLIVDGGHVYAGPRCLDLREPPAEDLPTTRVRDGVRHRLTLAPVPARVPFAGWVTLAWGDRAADVVAVPPAARVPLLAPAASWLLGEQDAGQLLDLAALPTWRLTRRRSRREVAASAGVLLGSLRARPPSLAPSG